MMFVLLANGCQSTPADKTARERNRNQATEKFGDALGDFIIEYCFPDSK
jgi:hypothetical protein